MSGLQVWDAAGNLIVDVTDRLQRKLGEVVIAAGATGSVTVAGGTPWYYVAKNGSSAGTAAEYAPTLSVSGNTISWGPNAVQGLGAVPVTLVYGVY